MNKILWLACILLGISLWLNMNSLKQAKIERNRQAKNVEVLLGDIERYKTKDSLNVTRLQALHLTLDEYKRYKREDEELIERLKMKGRDVTGITFASTITKDTLWTNTRDTIIQRDSVQVKGECFDISHPYIEMHGCIVDGMFSGQLTTYDSLLVIESVKRKRFLGFLWKTKKIKDRYIDVLSRNPNTIIADAEVVTIEY